MFGQWSLNFTHFSTFQWNNYNQTITVSILFILSTHLTLFLKFACRFSAKPSILVFCNFWHLLVRATYPLVPIRYFRLRRTDSSLPLHKRWSRLPVSLRSDPHGWQRLKSKKGKAKRFFIGRQQNYFILFYYLVFHAKLLEYYIGIFLETKI